MKIINCAASLLLSLILLAVRGDAYAFVPRSRSLAAVPRSSAGCLTMKIYDWKRREADESAINDVETFQFTLDNLRAAPGSRKRKTRKGRGISAGQGATCGFGMRGQNSRKGRPSRPGFEGGQTPLYRRLPKFVGKPTRPGHEKILYNIISTDVLQSIDAGCTVSFDSLFESKKISKSKFGLHKIVMGRKIDSPLSKNLVVQAHAFTGSAREAIEAAGGRCEFLSSTTNQVVGDAST